MRRAVIYTCICINIPIHTNTYTYTHLQKSIYVTEFAKIRLMG